tara:strand:+ start:380 stop:979 length:600 start_codon:yes stop_codon:yes gene_type:complete
MSYRIEDKIPVTKYDRFILHEQLNEKGMKKLFPDRSISSIYFDNRELKIYQDSIEGLLPRKKFRIRNYNKIKNYSFETKISSVEGRFKTSQQISIEEYDGKIKNGYLDSQYGLVKPLITVSYTRMYFQYNNLRITIDLDIEFSHFINPKKYFKSDKNVLETKSPNLNDRDFINNLIPFEKKRFSKYTEAIESLNLLNFV